METPLRFKAVAAAFAALLALVLLPAAAFADEVNTTADALPGQVAALVEAGDASASETVASGLTDADDAAALMANLTDEQRRYVSVVAEGDILSGFTYSVVIYAEPQWSSLDELAAQPSTQSDATLQETLESGWGELASEITIYSYGISYDDITREYVDSIVDAPEYFNVRVNWSCLIDDDDLVVAVKPRYLTTDSTEYKSMKSTYEAAVSEALAKVPEHVTDLSKVKILHDWLCDKAAYNNAAVSNSSAYPKSFTSYGCIAEGVGVCQSYSLALSDLLERAGVENTSLLVTTKNHAWNMVNVDDQWYHVDATWDDGDTVKYSYFMKSDTGIAKGNTTHADWDASTSYGWDGETASDTSYDSYDWSSYDAASDTIGYDNTQSATSGNVTFTVSYDNPVAGKRMAFHLEATGGSGSTKYYMGAPGYYDTDGSYEVLCDPTRVGGYTEACESYDYAFTPTASGTYRFEFNMMDTAAGVTYNRLTFNITVSDSEHPSVSQIVTNAVSKARAATDGSDYQMALYLHDWLLDQLEYDNSLYWCSAESALTRGLGTCESYQRAYAKLLNSAGIANARMEGNGHTWNAVKMDGAWYQVDPTWDDSDDDWYAGVTERHLYFGLTDELMAIAHSDHAATYTADGYGYRSSTLANNALVRSGEAAELVAAYSDAIQEQLDAGSAEFGIAANNTSWPPSIKGIVNGIVAWQMGETSWSSGNRSAAVSATYADDAFALTAVYTEREPSTISLEDQSTTYTGEKLAYTGTITKTGSTGKVTLFYYTDKDCTQPAQSVKNAGTYYVKATVAADSNYNEATSAAAKFTIGPAGISNAKIGDITGQTYKGSAIMPAVTVALNGKTLVNSTDYTVAYSSNTNAGTAMVTVTGKGNYSGTLKSSFTIAKAANPGKVKASTKTVKAKKLKKKAQTVKSLKVTKAKGKVTYKKTSGSKKLTVNKKTGNVKIKKGTKKGTYKIKVKVTAKGSANYKALTKTATVKVKVK